MPNVDKLFEDVKNDLFNLSSKDNKLVTRDNNKPLLTDNEYQNPIKGSYGNSGNYSPGVATDPRHKSGHNGVDLWAPGGTPVYAITEGKVISVISGGKGGNTITIQHPNNVKTYYAHLGTVNVKQDEEVGKDKAIGTIGDSGNAKGTFPHLHLQVWENNQLKNPNSFIDVPKYSLPQNQNAWLSEEDKKKANEFKSKVAKIEFIEKLANLYCESLHPKGWGL